MLRAPTRLLPGLVLVAPLALGQGNQRVETLTYEVPARWDAQWDLVLATETWHPVGATIEVGGHVFAAEVQGTQLALDCDADGELDRRVGGTAGSAFLHVPAGAFRYALRLRNVHARWEWAAGGMLVGRVSGTPVRIVDLDGDGRHDRYGVDALWIGRAPATLLSRVASLDGVLVHFDLVEDLEEGATLTLRPYEGPVATLDVKSGFVSSGTLESALFCSDEICLDAALARRGALVPAGRYVLAGGRVARGARTARIAPGRFEPIELEPGDERVLEWGGPLLAEFSFTVQADQLTVHPDVRFFGNCGAEFTDFAPVVRAPKLFVEDAESGQLVQYGNFGGCCGGGYSAWRATVPRGLKLTVRLEHDRKLFGPIAGRGQERASGSRKDR